MTDRIAIAALGLAAVLGGCGSQENGSISMLKAGVASLRAPEPQKAPPMTRAQLDALTVPMIEAEVEARDTYARLVLVGENRGHQTWIAADGVSVTLKGGVLTETRGLGEDRMTTDVAQVLEMLEGARPEAVRTHRYLDAEGHLFDKSYLCEITAREADAIAIVDRRISTEKLTESCHGAGARFENTYWRDGAGRIVAGRHWVGPGIGYLNTTLLKG